MGGWWPWGRSRQTAPAPAAALTAADPGWRGLAPIQRATSPMSPTAVLQGFAATLTVAHDPGLLSPPPPLATEHADRLAVLPMAGEPAAAPTPNRAEPAAPQQSRRSWDPRPAVQRATLGAAPPDRGVGRRVGTGRRTGIRRCGRGTFRIVDPSCRPGRAAFRAGGKRTARRTPLSRGTSRDRFRARNDPIGPRIVGAVVQRSTTRAGIAHPTRQRDRSAPADRGHGVDAEKCCRSIGARGGGDDAGRGISRAAIDRPARRRHRRLAGQHGHGAHQPCCVRGQND